MNFQDIAVREATATDRDITVVDAFIRDLANEEGLPATTATRDDLAAALFGDNSIAHALLAEIDSQPAGFALYYPKYSTVTGRRGLHLEDIYVAPQHRGRRVGQAIMQHLQDLAGPAGMVEWWVMHSNDNAIGFYQRLGAIELDGIAVHRLDNPSLGVASRITGLSSRENPGGSEGLQSVGAFECNGSARHADRLAVTPCVSGGVLFAELVKQE